MRRGANEIILRSNADREPMDFNRLKFLCWFTAGMTAMVLTFAVVIIFIIRVT